MKGDPMEKKNIKKDTKKDGRVKNRGTPNNNGGRPKKELNVKLLNELCMLQCTGEEIASVMEMNYDTLNARIKEQFNISFSEYYEQKKDLGRVSLRRKQAKLATKNAAMAIFLGKNILGQKDRMEVDQTNLNFNADLELSEEEADNILKGFGINFEVK